MDRDACTKVFRLHFKRQWIGMMAIVLTTVHRAMQQLADHIQGTSLSIILSFCICMIVVTMHKHVDATSFFFSNVFFDFPRRDLHREYNQVVTNGLQHHPSRSRSVPEGLAHGSIQGVECHCSRNHWRSQSFRHLKRPMHVVEQITTSV